MTSPITDISSVTILYEDEGIFALDKPPLIHSVQGNGPSIADLLLKNDPNLAKVAEKEGDAGLVNRLDFETSGALIVAKSRDMWTMLRDLWSQGKVKKTYLARVEGVAPESTRVVGYIGGRSRRASKVILLDSPAPRFIFTESLIRRIAVDPGGASSTVAVETYTGARHQVRVHLASIGHPLLGDSLYGATPQKRPFELIASRIQWPAPAQEVIVESQQRLRTSKESA